MVAGRSRQFPPPILFGSPGAQELKSNGSPVLTHFQLPSYNGCSMMSSLPFSQKKLTLIFGRYTGIRVYEDAAIGVRNNQFIIHWEGSNAR